MSFDEIRTACVIHYPYLWVREASAGETEGRKHRPVAVGIRYPTTNGEDLLLLLPITTQPPQPGRFAVEIPEIEKRRAGLEVAVRLWLIFDEYNEDVIGKSFYLEPDPPLGRFSMAFFLPLMREFIRRRSEARGINRHR
ncbi:MAG: hypothetical protein AB7F09_13065 [Parvibaculaceae bacterium]